MFYTNQPPKLVDSRKHGANSGAELFVVEGDSASLAVAKQRDGTFQAVLPMQGKPMHPMRVSQEKLLENTWYAALIDAIGAGIGEQCLPEKRQYEKIILLMDPDADGIHCGALMTLFFSQWMRPLLDTGAIYLVRPPVGQSTDMVTQEATYYDTAPDFRQALDEVPGQNQDIMKYRGLAGIPANSLATCCIDPETRKQIKLGIKDAQMAQKIFG